MKLVTGSGIISFAKRLETDSEKIYRTLIRASPEGADLFSKFIEENERTKLQLEQSYYSFISDVFEGCFSFEDVDTDDFLIETQLPKTLDYLGALNIAIAIEEKIIKFYSTAAQAASALMTDLQRLFEEIAKEKEQRMHTLRSLIAAQKRSVSVVNHTDCYGNSA